MCSKYLIYNETSTHTLLSTYQMQEMGIIVDDVSKHHLKDEGTHGTHSMKFPGSEHALDLETRGALPTFRVMKPTMEEYLNAQDNDIVDIAFPNWNPQDHYDEAPLLLTENQDQESIL